MAQAPAATCSVSRVGHSSAMEPWRADSHDGNGLCRCQRAVFSSSDARTLRVTSSFQVPRRPRHTSASWLGATYAAGSPSLFSIRSTGIRRTFPQPSYCLLYTSDAADDLLCVDLGGRRI